MLCRFIFFSLAALISASVAHGFQFVVTDITVTGTDGSTDGASTATISAGEQVTIDVQMINDLDQPIGAIGAFAFGYDTSVVSFVSAEVAGTAMNTAIADFTDSGLGFQPTGGISAGVGTAGAQPAALAAPNRDVVAETAPGLVTWFNGIQSTLPTPPNTGEEFDIGIAGDLITNGDVHARFVFQGVDTGQTGINIGPDNINGGVVIGTGEILGTDIGTTVDMIVVPEPVQIVGSLAGLVSVIGIATFRRMKSADRFTTSQHEG